MFVVSLLLTPHGVGAQSGAASAELRGQVSAAVAVSINEAVSPSGQTRVSFANVDATTVAVNISGSGDREARVRLPLRLRSNVGYGLRASFLSTGELNVRLSVPDVRATGRFVHAGALKEIRLDEALARARGGRGHSLSVHRRPLPIAILSGPPISKAGTFTSPDNAIEVTLDIEVLPQPASQSWSTQLTLSAAPLR